jgi:polysaccharide deacetylase family protein (PEP-CTERM system associated)
MSVKHAISFDVEEYFQVANLRVNFPKAEWDGIESRLDVGMQHILRALEKTSSRATFFFLGWIAERYPEWVVRCLEAGHEVASHGYDHDFLWDLGPEGAAFDLARTEAALAAAGAPRPRGFRASTFTLTERTLWAFDLLVEAGYTYDSSVHPVTHPTYGIPDFAPGVSRVERPAGHLVEFPVSTKRLLGRNLPMGGGGYFRLYPGSLIRSHVGALDRRGEPACLYLHPWEFDPAQPRVKTGALKSFRHYVGLHKTLAKLEALLARFEFVGLEEALEAHGAFTR